MDPFPCNNGALREMAAAAGNISQPLPLFPVFWKDPQCGKTPGTDISSLAGSIWPVSTSDVKLLDQDPRTFDRFNTSHDYNEVLNPISWYVPPNFLVYIGYVSGARVVDCARYGPGSLVTNVDEELMISGRGYPVPHALNAGDNILYVYIYQLETTNEMLIDVCTSNRFVSIGSSTTFGKTVGGQNSLNEFWEGGTAGCDEMMTGLCKSNSIAADGRTCACFIQQKNLDEEFGEDLAVPVLCFGHDKSGDKSRACVRDPKAYKTHEMRQNSCSFAQCQTIVAESAELQASSNTPGNVQCFETNVSYPVSSSGTTPTPEPTEVVDNLIIGHDVMLREFIPSWVWYVVIGAGTFLIAFLFSLIFT